MLEKEELPWKKQHYFITALFGASLANAHNVWLEPAKDAKGQYVVKFGHEERNPEILKEVYEKMYEDLKIEYIIVLI